MPITGGCQCGAIRFEITGPLMGVGHCHCNACRKAQGSAFRTRARVRKADFRWLSGEAEVRNHQSSPGFHRGFCCKCGSPVVTWKPTASPSAASMGIQASARASTASSPSRRPGTTSPTTCRNTRVTPPACNKPPRQRHASSPSAVRSCPSSPSLWRQRHHPSSSRHPRPLCGYGAWW